MLIVAVVSPERAPLLHRIGPAHTLTFVSARDRDSPTLLTDVTGAAQTPAEVLLLDCDAGPGDAMAQALRQYRATRPNVRVILLAPERQYGDPLLSDLVGLGVYDVLSVPSDQIHAAVAGALDRPPATYADAAAWHVLRGQGVPQGASHRTESQPRETWRVLAGQARPLLIAVAGASRAAGTTDLAWQLAYTLARRGVPVAFFADLATAERNLIWLPLVAEAGSLPSATPVPGLPLVVHPYDRTPPRGCPPDQPEPWQPADRLTAAMQNADEAAVIVVDVGDLLPALSREPQLLAIADRVLLVWPQSVLRLTLAERVLSVQARHPSVKRAVTRALHVAYLASAPTAESTGAALGRLATAMAADLPQFTVVSASQRGPDLTPLLAVLAPARDRRGRPVVLKGRLLLEGLQRAAGLPVGSAPPAGIIGATLRVVWRLALAGAGLWLLLGLLVFLGVPVPTWLGGPFLAHVLAGLWRTLVP